MNAATEERVRAAASHSPVAADGLVVCLNPMLDPAGPSLLERAGARVEVVTTNDPARMADLLAEADAVVVRLPARFPRELVDAAPRARILATSGAGTDHVDVAAATAAGLPVVNNPGIGHRAVAEHAFGLVLTVVKRIAEADRRLRGEGWASREGFLGPEMSADLSGRTLGILGYGAIGREIARIGHHGFDMRVAAFSRNRPADLPEWVEWKADQAELCAVADVLSISVPSSPETSGLLDAAAIGRLRPEAIVVNVARGSVLDEAALVAALEEGRIAGAGLDVFAEEPLPPRAPILSAPNVVATPHVAGISRQACRRLALSAARQVAAALAGERPDHLVNPQVWPRRRR